MYVCMYVDKKELSTANEAFIKLIALEPDMALGINH